MGIKNKISEGYLYFLTLTVVDWVDVFTRPVYKYLIVDSLIHCQKEKGLDLYSWCLMTNHIHLIAGSKEGYSLEKRKNNKYMFCHFPLFFTRSAFPSERFPLNCF